MKKFLTFIKIIGLIAACLLIAFLVVWPLWKFAITAPKVYTWFIGIALIGFILFLIGKKIYKKTKRQ